MATAADYQASQTTTLSTSLDLAQGFINQLAQFVNLAEPDIGELPTPNYEAAVANLYNLFQIPAPLIPGQVVNVPLPTAPDLSFSTVESVTVPEFSQTAPQIDIPSSIPLTLPTAPAQPDVLDIALPTAPATVLPVVPSLAAISIPTPPSISIPSFTAGLPAEDFVTPSNTFSFAEQAYSDALLDAEKTKLLDDLVNGGYGIEPLDETNLWNRARDREVDTTLMEIDESYRAAGARGFPLPPDDTAVVIERALQKQQEKLSSVSREIAIQRAALYVDNRKFTIQQVRELEATLINFHNSVQERALNAQKITLDAAIAVYEAQLKRFTSRLDAYRTEAQVFEARVRAVAQQVEIYRSQIQAAQVTAEVQRLQIETYNAQLRGVELTVQIYRTQVEASNVAAQVQRVKIEAYQALIQAYTAQVQAQVAQQNAYEARVRGELAKAQVFETQAKAYSATVEGLKAKSEVLIARARAEWEQARVKIERYHGEIQGADINLRSQLGIVNANVQTYAERTRLYSAQLNALGEQLRLDETAIQNSREIQVKQAEVQIEQAKLRLARAIETLKVQLGGFTLGGDYYKNLLAALAGSMQSLASVSQTA